MENSFRIIFFLLMGLLFVACVPSVADISSPTAPTTMINPVPSQSPTIAVESTSALFSDPSDLLTFVFPDGTNIAFPTQNPKIPTLLPTIDPESARELLDSTLSMQTLAEVNGHTTQKITGWDYGFRTQPCSGYQWLDSNHLLLYPRTGETNDGFHLEEIDLSSELVVINLTDGNYWLQEPLSSTPFSAWGLDCNGIHWSQQLGIIIDQKTYATVSGPSKEAVFVYTFDGKEIARYWGKIVGVSPRGTKVLVDDDTIIDLNNGEITDLSWHMDYDLESWTAKLYWSSDETRLYRCCFYFADLKTGRSYNLEWSDLRGADGKPIPFSMQSPHVGGRWVRNDTYFFPMWDYMSYAGDPTVIFSPAEKKYYGIELPEASNVNPETILYTISPDGMYVWAKGYGFDSLYHGFLLNLTTLKTVSSDMPVDEIHWSPDSKYAWVMIHDKSDKYVLSIDGKSTLFPVKPINEPSWHPTDHILAFLAENDQSLALLNAKDMTIQGSELPVSVFRSVWSPTGDRMLFISKDRSLWQVDYPSMENFEQLTDPVDSIQNILWSPDGKSVAFISGPDIYIVDTTK